MKRVIVAATKDREVDTANLTEAANTCRKLSADSNFVDDEKRDILLEASKILDDAVTFYMYTE